ncbi:MAG: DNA-binding response OmpR family regulator [bacterium]|jgi:DNA-binding response OmpR family regulator
MKSAKTVLIIEDEKQVRESIVDILKLKGYKTLEASDGTVGFELAKSKIPDVVLCDIMMPNMDGFETISKFKANSLTKYIKFIFLTAKIEEENRTLGIELGASAYITKPFTVDQLLTAIESEPAARV